MQMMLHFLLISRHQQKQRMVLYHSSLTLFGIIYEEEHKDLHREIKDT